MDFSLPNPSLASVRGRIDIARKASPLASAAVTLVAASKTIPAAELETFIASGVRHFGENRMQEALEKWPSLKERHPDLVLHFIGPLQTNKVKDALRLFDILETVDREKLVDAIAKEGGGPECFIQVNTGEEPQKGGVAPQEADALVAYARAKGLNVTGLMCVPPADENPGPHFALLREIAKRNRLPNLSMGMSSDFETAIRFGATHVRIGSLLFGERR